MKKFLILFLLLCTPVWAADSKLTALDAITPDSADMMYCVDDVGGTPASKSCLVSALLIDANIPDTITIDNATLAAQATALETARLIGGVSFDGTANIVPTTIAVTDTTDATSFVCLFESATGDLLPQTDLGITYNATTANLATTTFTGALSGNSTTSTALAADPSDCGANTFAQSIVANGNLTCANVDVSTADITGTLAVGNGGTGAASLTDGGILLGSNTSAITALGVASNGQIPIGDGATDPVLATITAVANETDVTNGAGSITIGIVSSPTLDGTNFTGIAAGAYAAASIDGDDINSNIAGTGLTLTSASPDTLDCDDAAADDSTKGCATFEADDFDSASGKIDLADSVAKSFVGDSGTATPSTHAITIAGGTNVTTSATGSTVTINSTGGGGSALFVWNLPVHSLKLASTNPMGIDAGNPRWRGLFDDTAPESASAQTVVINYQGGTLKSDLTYSMLTATTGVVEYGIKLMCVSSLDAQDIDVNSFDVANNISGTVPGTAGHSSYLTVTLANADSCADKDMIIAAINRNPAVSGDATGDSELRTWAIYEE